MSRLEVSANRDVLILCLGDPVHIGPALTAGSGAFRRSFVGSCNAGPQIMRHERSLTCLQIALPPWATVALFGNDYRE